MDRAEGFQELKRYVGLTAKDEARLAALQAPLEDALEDILDAFYDTILVHPGASAAFRDPEVQVPRQRSKLADWIRSLLRGPYDLGHCRRTERVGQIHVVHRLPQRYMHGAMNIIRRGLVGIAFRLFPHDPAVLEETVHAIDRVLDVELWIMLRSYRDDLVLRMKRKERLATVGELSAGIHHELKNPLAAIGAASVALEERRSMRADSRGRALVQSIRQEADRASEIVSDLLSFARMRTPNRESVAPDELVEAAISRVIFPPKCRLDVDLDPAPPRVHVDRAQVLQVLINVLENAVDACPDGGAIRLASRLENDALLIRVTDEGVGMGPEELSRVFEPLYSTKPDGVGLGMSLSLQLAQANRVGLEVDSRAGMGTTVRLTLPLTEA